MSHFNKSGMQKFFETGGWEAIMRPVKVCYRCLRVSQPEHFLNKSGVWYLGCPWCKCGVFLG